MKGDDTPLGMATDPRAPAAAPVFMIGARVLHYEIVGFLGGGGMGDIYRATDVRLGRDVALKVVRPEASSAEGSGRLLAEAQAMARLSHPNVVAIYDVGEVRDRVFIAMELVEGQTLRAWLAAAPRGRGEILDAFARAGRGLAAAHRAGLVHRDFKPDNVLVGRDGTVRVADFGLAASALDVGPAGGSGTPAYMAPEQHGRGAIDARADQFAFAVSLYEALHGDHPFAGDDPEALRANAASGRIAAPGAASMPSWLRTLVLRGLSPTPELRFPSMDAFVDALGRDPAAARRRWLGVAAVAALSAAGAAALVHRQAAPPCAGAAAHLAGVWDPAVAAAVRQAFAGSGRPFAEATYTRVAAALDGYTAGWTAMRGEACEATTVRHEQSEALLDLRMECLDRRLGELRALTALFAAGPDPGIVDHAAAAVARLEDVAVCADAQALSAAQPLPTDVGRRARIAALRTKLQGVRALALVGKARPALEALTALRPEAHEVGYEPLELEVLVLENPVLGQLRRTKDMEATQREELVLASRLHDDRRAAAVWCDLIVLVGDIDHRPDEALAMRTGAEAAMERAGGTPAMRAALASALGRVHQEKGDRAEAERLLRQAVTLLEATPGKNDMLLAASLNTLGFIFMMSGRLDEARAVFERIGVIYERDLTSGHPYVAGTLLNLAAVLQRQGRLAEARAIDERAAATFEAVEGPDGQDVGEALTNLGATLLDDAAYEDAIPHLQRALAIMERRRGPDDRETAGSLLPLGVALAHLGRYDQAGAAIDRARAIYEKTAGEAEPDYASALAARAVMAELRGDCAAADDDARRSVDIDERAIGRDNPELITPLLVLGRCELALGRPRASLAPLQRALFIRVAKGGPPGAVPEAQLALARARWQLGDRGVVPLGEQSRAAFAALGPRYAARATAAADWLRITSR